MKYEAIIWSSAYNQGFPLTTRGWPCILWNILYEFRPLPNRRRKCAEATPCAELEGQKEHVVCSLLLRAFVYNPRRLAMQVTVPTNVFPRPCSGRAPVKTGVALLEIPTHVIPGRMISNKCCIFFKIKMISCESEVVITNGVTWVGSRLVT